MKQEKSYGKGLIMKSDAMPGAVEKLTIRIRENQVVLTSHQEEEKEMSMTAMEALMLLDILKSEENRLREMADAARPIPMGFSFEGNEAEKR